MKHDLVKTTITNEKLQNIIRQYYKEQFEEDVNITIEEEITNKKEKTTEINCKVTKIKKDLIIEENLSNSDIKEILNWYIEDCKIKKVVFHYNEKKSGMGIYQNLQLADITLKEKPKKRVRK